jgi:hypothetical protein
MMPSIPEMSVENSMTTKKTLTVRAKKKDSDALAPEYRFNYSAPKANRFAGQIRQGSVAVLLDPDVAEFFTDPKSVNAVLRALIATMPPRRRISR